MKTRLKKGIVLVMLCALVLGMGIDASAEDVTSDLNEMVTLVNNFRTGSDAWYKNPDGTVMNTTGLTTLAVDSTLQQYAMLRANELAQNFSHTRPGGGSALDWNGVYGENIAWGQGSLGTAASIFESWKETSYGYDGQGHRRNMLGILHNGSGVENFTFTTIGVGHARIGGVDYWVQLFGGGTQWNASEHITASTSAPDQSTQNPDTTTPEQPTAPEQPAAPQYSFKSGAASTWAPGSSDPLVITCDGDFSKFTGITISGVDIDPANYDAWSGSTVISLKPAFMQSLSEGTYTFRVNYTDGSAETTFTVGTAPAQDNTTTTQGNTTAAANTAKSPKTGEGMMSTQGMPSVTVVASIVVLLAAVSVVAGMKLRKRA